MKNKISEFQKQQNRLAKQRKKFETMTGKRQEKQDRVKRDRANLGGKLKLTVSTGEEGIYIPTYLKVQGWGRIPDNVKRQLIKNSKGLRAPEDPRQTTFEGVPIKDTESGHIYTPEYIGNTSGGATMTTIRIDPLPKPGSIKKSWSSLQKKNK